MSKKAFFYLLPIAIIYCGIEVFSFAAGKYLHKNGVLYVASLPASGSFERYQAKRDSVLGWPDPESFGTGDLDSNGARISPAYANDAKACISLYGDSFTWSSEVSNGEAWGNLLAELVDCKVSNFGVGGYGTDQAYLRFTQSHVDKADIVLLNHWTENIRRNVNQFRYVLDGSTHFSLKPRFILNEEDGLQLIPIPELSEQQYMETVRDPQSHLQHEYFMPNQLPGFATFQFPYSLAVGRSINHHLVRAKLNREPFHTEFYRADHPSKSMVITAYIMERFHSDALAAEKTPVLTIIPSNLDLLYFQREGDWVYQSLINMLNERGIKVLNLGPPIIEYAGERDICEFFRPTNCNAHFNAEGYAILANAVSDHLHENGLAP